MNKILGLPRNAAIALLGVLISAGSLLLAFLIPWQGTEKPTVSPVVSTSTAPATTQALASAPATQATPDYAATAPGKLDYKRITVNFDNLPPDQAMQAFSDSTNFQVDGGGVVVRTPVPIEPVSMHLKDAPLLEGILALANGSRTLPQELTTSRAILRPGGDASVGKVYVAGAFAIVIQRFQNSIDLSQNPPRFAGQMHLDFYVEPGLKVLQFPPNIALEQFEDEKKQVLFAGQTYGSSSYGRNMPRSSLQIPLSFPRDRGKKIAIMKGTATFLIAPRTEPVKTSAPEETLSRTIGDLGVDILPIKPEIPPGGAANPNNRSFTLSIRYRRRHPDPQRWQQTVQSFYQMQPTLFDANDQPFPMNSYGTNQTQEGEEAQLVTYTIRPTPQQPDPHHVQIDLPVEIREVRVPFEFKDIILP